LGPIAAAEAIDDACCGSQSDARSFELGRLVQSMEGFE